MASYKQTFVAFAVLAIVIVTGTLVFTAIEENGYENNFSLTLQIVTTIGYGNVPPKTNSGKIFCIFFSIIGIPVNIVFLQKVGEHMMNLQKFAISKIEMKVFKRSEPKNLDGINFAFCVIDLVVFVVIGAVIQMYSEDWSFLDGVYCYVITFTTVGFGDLIPGFDLKSPATRILMSLFGILGLCVVSTTINCALECSILAYWLRRLPCKKTVTAATEESKVEEITAN